MNEYYTNPNLPGPQYEEEEIDIMEYVSKLLKNWKFIVKWGCVGIAVGLVFALSIVKSYTVNATLAPEVTSRSGGGGLSSLASLAGVNLNSLSTSDALNPDIYPEIVASIPFKVELLETEVTYASGKPEEQKMSLYTYLDEYVKGPWYNAVLSAPGKALGWIIGLVTGMEKEDPGTIDPENLTNKQNGMVKFISENVSITVDKKTSLITVSAKMGEPVIAKEVCDKVIENLLNYVIEYRTEKARKDVEYYEMLNAESRDKYYSAQQRYARYVDSNQGITRNSFMIESERLRNESELAFSLYNQTAQQLQLAQAKIQMETPVCVILQPTSVPLKGEPSRAKTLAIWVFLFGACACAWVLWGDMAKEMLAKAMEEQES